MTTRASLEEWIREIEERPESATEIVRAIANRLIELEKANEDLREKNIELRLENKVEAYEDKIAKLEYQIELLRRQLPQDSGPAVEGKELLVFNRKNQILRKLIPGDSDPSSQQKLAHFSAGSELQDDEVQLKTFNTAEEILLIFDTGHAVATPLASLPSAPGDEMDWAQAYQEDPDSIEKLITILPISRLPLYEYCVQISRRGFAKRMPAKSFQNYIAKKNIGTGIRQQPDKPFEVILGNAGDTVVIVSKDGYLNSLSVEALPFAIEPVINLGVNDYIVAAFVIQSGASLLIVTKDGKIVHRDVDWLTPANSFRTQGQSIFSRKVRERGTQVIAAAQIQEGDGGIYLNESGQIMKLEIQEALNQGSLLNEGENLLAFTIL